jgi:hypothetical protein
MQLQPLCVPHKGWTCIYYEVLDYSMICEMCDGACVIRITVDFDL